MTYNAEAAKNLRWDRAIVGEIRRLNQGDDTRWIGLAELRQLLDSRGTSRDAQDAHLKRMSKARLVDIAGESNRKTLTTEDHAAAIRIGGEDNHLIKVHAS